MSQTFKMLRLGGISFQTYFRNLDEGRLSKNRPKQIKTRIRRVVKTTYFTVVEVLAFT